jgi:hypothetical protein
VTRRFLFLSLILIAPAAHATSWHSAATGLELKLTLLQPTNALKARAPVPVVFYLQNLAAPRIGTEPDAPIIGDLRAAGNLVVLLDYARHPAARWPQLNRDFAALRRQLHQRALLEGVRPDYARIFIVPSGHRLKRNVVFDRRTSRTLAMDIIYPSNPAVPVGAVLEFSCDNENRMGNYSLQACTDTILEGAATEGFAVAMADHPVAAPYEGIDAMPDCARLIKAAVRTLRAEGGTLGLNSRIVPFGFSRGSGMALMLVTTSSLGKFDGFGEHPGVGSEVQGAVVMSGRFTYLDLRTADPMISRYNKFWGKRSSHFAEWREHGALDYLSRPAAVPLFLTINRTESPDALHQMEVLRHRLDKLSSPYEYHLDAEPRGHKVPVSAAVLQPLLKYLIDRLSVAPTASQTSPMQP